MQARVGLNLGGEPVISEGGASCSGRGILPVIPKNKRARRPFYWFALGWRWFGGSGPSQP